MHNHDKTFYNYGTDHQECLAHILRYLKDSIDNEPERSWNKEMRALVQEMLHYGTDWKAGQNVPRQKFPDSRGVSRVPPANNEAEKASKRL